MSEKFNSSDLTEKELASQLKKPSGEQGKEVGKQMNKGNKYICLNSYNCLAPSPNANILEIGMGNGFFIKDLLALNTNLRYVGLDFSQTMIDEATKLNQAFMESGQVSFINGSIEKLPFEDNSMDCITTTNTIYFWPNLEANAKELFRVLKPKGKLLIGYRSQELMDKISFTKHNFEKYSQQEVELLLKTTGFQKVSTEIIAEPELDFDGIPMVMEGLFTTGIKE